MKGHKFKNYIYAGAAAVLVIGICTAIVFAFLKWNSVTAGFRVLNRILAPITYGAILAYLLTPIYNKMTKAAYVGLGSMLKNPKKRTGVAKMAGTVASLVFLAAVVIGLFWMVIPQVVSSIVGIINTLPTSAENTSIWIQTVLANNPDVEGVVLNLYNQGVDKLIAWSTTDLVPSLERIISGVFSGVMGIVNLVMNSLIGVIVMVYILNIKNTLCAQAKKSIYGFCSIQTANHLVDEFRYGHRIFGGFIIGKLVDSLIIGIICFVCLKFMKMPYVVLISVIIGVTNVIPFFGPFIGAVPSALLILLVSPSQCLYFLIFILLLQQFDGNILGPKILGNSTGLSSFWVLFSILLFGGLLGPIGMIIGVPTFAVFYRLISEKVTSLLHKRNLSTDTADYWNLDYIDESSKEYVPTIDMTALAEDENDS